MRFLSERPDLAQSKCACGAPAGLTGQCVECASKNLIAQRQESDDALRIAAPPTVSDVLGSSGEPLDSETRASMESRFGHDFSNVRVHTDEQAAESARAIDASAYTVGQDIVFGAGKYEPHSLEGRKRLAHELTHVVQQKRVPGRVSSTDAGESEARRVGEAVSAGGSAEIKVAVAFGQVHRDQDKTALDSNAKAIVALAKGEKPAADRATAVVKAIIDQYYSSDKALIYSVAYDNAKAGSGVHAEQKFSPSSKPEESTGTIYVGDTFLSGVTDANFARRVLQVGHEIEHIHQWREGLAGGQKSNEREFLAFYHEALLPEKPGTGRMQLSTRLRLIDAALGNYYCLAADKQTDYAAKKKELLEKRASEISAGGTPDTKDAPTECKKSS